jgi:hypothetical protein
MLGDMGFKVNVANPSTVIRGKTPAAIDCRFSYRATRQKTWSHPHD